MENLVSTFNKLHAKSSGYGGTGRPGAGETAETPTELLEAVDRMGLLASGDKPRMTALAGGVSSDIWRLDLARGTVCVKRALPKLRVSRRGSLFAQRRMIELRLPTGKPGGHAVDVWDSDNPNG